MFDQGDYCHDYRIKGFLGKGKDGPVYLATSMRGKGVDYALKSILIQDMNTTERNLIKRCAVQVLLEHKNIVNARQFFFFEEERYLIIVMQKCGLNLHDYLQKRSGILEEQTKLEFVNGIVNGLHAIHEKGYIHKDLNTQNIFISNNQLKIGDFGRINERAIELTSSTKNFNFFSPPELIQKEGGHTKGSDIYSAGIIIMQILLGKNFIKDLTRCPATTPGFPQNYISQIKEEKYQKVLRNAFNKVPEDRRLQCVQQKQLTVYEVFERINTSLGGDKLIEKECKCQWNYSLHYESNKLMACIDLNKQNEVTGIVLLDQMIGQSNFELLCAQRWNKLWSLNLSNNKIESLSCLNKSEWSSLTWLRLDNNPIRNYSVQHLPFQLNYLALNYNKLTADDIRNINKSFLKGLNQLNLFDCDIGNDGLKCLLHSVNKNLKVLQIGKNKLTDESIDLLMQFKELTKLYMQHNNFTKESIVKFCQLPFLQHLTQLAIIDIPLGMEGAKLIASSKMTNLQKLYFGYAFKEGEALQLCQLFKESFNKLTYVWVLANVKSAKEEEDIKRLFGDKVTVQ